MASELGVVMAEPETVVRISDVVASELGGSPQQTRKFGQASPGRSALALAAAPGSPQQTRKFLRSDVCTQQVYPCFHLVMYVHSKYIHVST